MRQSSAMQEPYGREERKRQLRRLDAILTTLEELNLQGVERVPARLVELLDEAGVANAHTASVYQLIDRVLAMQQPFLVKVQMERRRRRRRTEPEPAQPGAVPKAS